MNTVNFRELLFLPNLLSLLRVGVALAVCYLLWLGGTVEAVVAIGLLVVAGVTDGLDGYLARRRNQVTKLGIALDPLCDKVFAVILIAGLIAFRSFPVWLAVMIVGRDLLILLGGLILSRGWNVSLSSNLTGKYTFAAIVVLLGSYIIRFDFGIRLLTPIVIVFLAASTVSYLGVFWSIQRNRVLEPFNDRTLFRVVRIIITVGISAVFLIKLYLDMIR